MEGQFIFLVLLLLFPICAGFVIDSAVGSAAVRAWYGLPHGRRRRVAGCICR
jgi:hypothetical protein